MTVKHNDRFAMIKSRIDAHTMGIKAAAALLSDCGYQVIIAPEYIEDIIDKISSEDSQRKFVEWIKSNKVNHLGISYRLDPEDAVLLVGHIIHVMKKNEIYETELATVKSVFFAGLTRACDHIDKEYKGRIKTFRGGENPEETLTIMGIPKEEIPAELREGCKYDKELLEFGKYVIQSEEYKKMSPLKKNNYVEFGTKHDTLELRLGHNFKDGFHPLVRAHSGPYDSTMTRKECIQEFKIWCRQLADADYLDILSIGTSQLSQSNFGENWDNKVNGGGVPINSEQEFIEVWKAARPMLVRTYSGTKNVKSMAEMYERTINNSWHALSLWWFNELDGRGPNSLYNNLVEHVDAIKRIAEMGKPVETNVPHHFAFRGCDDATYVVSGYLSAKMAKKCGVKTFVLQNMLNTPRSTWGVQDIAKARVLLKLVKELEDNQFRVVLQTRAGLDYFKPDIEFAKAQLAAVTAMMDDIDPYNLFSPEIIHVVSYSEALFLATPDILNDSIKITRTALEEYRKRKKRKETPDVMTEDIFDRTDSLEKTVRAIIKAMEDNIADLYSPEGLYIAFTAGFLPVPELWSDAEKYRHAKEWGTKGIKGGYYLTDKGVLISVDARINKCISNISDAKFYLGQEG